MTICDARHPSCRLCLMLTDSPMDIAFYRRQGMPDCIDAYGPAYVAAYNARHGGGLSGCGCKSGLNDLEGCGCRYGLGEGPSDTAWHKASALGALFGALALWFLRRDDAEEYEEDRRRRHRSVERDVRAYRRSRSK